MAGALAGGFGFGLLNLAWDVVGNHMHWWWYPAATPRSLGPWYWYAAAGLEYGAGFGLIGWRATRRWGARGLLGFLIGFTLFGMARDYVASSTVARDVITFAGGIWPWVADGIAWFSLGAMAQVVMRLVSGPAISDRLRENRKGDKMRAALLRGAAIWFRQQPPFPEVPRDDAFIDDRYAVPAAARLKRSAE